MKKFASLLAVLALSTLLAHSQDAKDKTDAKDSKPMQSATGAQAGAAVADTAHGTAPQPVTAGQALKVPPQAPLESQATVKTNETKAEVNVPRPTTKVLGKHVTFGGYFTDFVRAERKRPLFDLKAPIDPKKDMENLSFYPGTDQVQGVILFSIKF